MQGDLFDKKTYPEAPGYQDTDTSKAAAEAVAPTVEHLREATFRAIQSAGAHGRTPDEAARDLGRDILSIRPRTTELNAALRIKDSGLRRKNKSGKKAIVWVVRTPQSG